MTQKQQGREGVKTCSGPATLGPQRWLEPFLFPPAAVVGMSEKCPFAARVVAKVSAGRVPKRIIPSTPLQPDAAYHVRVLHKLAARKACLNGGTRHRIRRLEQGVRSRGAFNCNVRPHLPRFLKGVFPCDVRIAKQYSPTPPRKARPVFGAFFVVPIFLL